MAKSAPRVGRWTIALLALAGQSAPAAAEYYSVTGGGAQFQIGNEIPLPLQPAVPVSKAVGKPIGTMTMFPPLLIPVNPDPAKALIQQTSGPDPKKMTIPPGVFRRPAAGPNVLGLVSRNPRLLQVRTHIEFSMPAPIFGSAMFRAGGRTGAATTFLPGPVAGGLVRFQKTTAQFGGPLQSRIAAATPALLWGWLGGPLPCKHPVFGGADTACQARLLTLDLGSLLAPGAIVGFTKTTPGGPPSMSPNVVFASIPNQTGLVAMSVGASTTSALTNMATTVGFPWTTGQIRVSSVSALAIAEVFTLTGMDSRMDGVGTISLVSGAISDRKLSGPNSHFAWLQFTVPEPGPALGAAVAIAALALCRALSRRTAA